MRLGPRSTIAMLSSVLAVVLSMRMPEIGHETGIDSFVMHGLANSLTHQARALWIISPLSYLGLYPLSYPSASIFTVADLALVGGIPMEGSLLVSSLLMCLVGVLGAFLLGHQLTGDARFALVMALLLGSAPRFVLNTIWETPFRSGFMALIPMLMWAVIRLHSRMGFANLFVFGVLVVLLPAFHRLAVLVVVILGAYLMTHAFVVGYHVLKMRFPFLLLSPKAMRLGKSVLLVGMALTGLAFLFGTDVLRYYSSGRLLEGDDPVTALANLGVSLIRSVGLILPLAVLGVIYFSQRRAKGVKELFTVAMALAIIPTLSLRTYTGFYAGAVLAPLAAGGVLFLSYKFNRLKIRALAAGVIMLAAVSASTMIVSADLPLQGPMSDQEYSTALYTRYSACHTTAFNDGLLGSRVAAISGNPYLPVGGASTVFTGPEVLIYRFVDPQQIVVQPIPFWQLDVNSDSPFVVTNVNAVQDWVDLLFSPINSGESMQLRQNYRVDCFAERRDAEGQFASFGRFFASPTLKSLPDSSYKLYEDESGRFWFVGLSAS